MHTREEEGTKDKIAKWIAIVFFVSISLSLFLGIGVMAHRDQKNREEAKKKWPASHMEYAEFDGHEYVMLEGWGTFPSGITHSPKCKCLQKGGKLKMNEEQVKQILELLRDVKGALSNIQAQLHELDKKVDLID